MKCAKKTKRVEKPVHFCDLSRRATCGLNSKIVGGNGISPWESHSVLITEYECARVRSGMNNRKIGQLMEQEPEHRKMALKARGQLWKRF